MTEDWSAIPEWINKADGDWAMLRLAQSQPGLEDGVVFHAHQCVEKLLKACLIQQGQPIRKIHDLVALSQQLHASDASWNWEEQELDDLTSAGVLGRYPGFETSAEEAAEIAELTARLRQALLQRLGVPPEATA